MNVGSRFKIAVHHLRQDRGHKTVTRPAPAVGHCGAMVEDGKKPAGGPVIKRRAEQHAAAFASTIQELRSAGFASRRALADELNRRGIPTARGGKWHYATVVRMLTRLGLLTSGNGGRINNGKAKKHASDARAKALAPTIAKLQKAGFVSLKAIARELSEQEIPSAQGGKWHPSSVSRLLQRLKRLETSSRTPEENAGPK